MVIFQSVKLIVITRRSARVSETYSLHTKKIALFSIPEIKCFIVNVILGLNLYLKLPFGKLHSRNPNHNGSLNTIKLMQKA